MPGIYNQTSPNAPKTAAPVRRFAAGEQMPPEMAACAAWHMRKERAEAEHERKRRNEEARRRARHAAHAAALAQGIEPEMRVPELSEEQRRKIQFCRLGNATNPNDYEDVGSQTDHSDVSDGQYSDETSEEQRVRVAVVEEKNAKRMQRLREIQRKHGIKQ